MSELQEKYATKITALLRKAESTTPEEAELLVDKAQDLMTRYGIEQAMLDATQRLEEIIRVYIPYEGPYRESRFNTGYAIATANSCRVLHWKEPKRVDLVLIGFEGDVTRVQFLDTSLQLQATGSMARWVKDNLQWKRMGGTERFRERREFLSNFAVGVGERLQLQKDVTVAAVVSESGGDGSGLELVLRSRKDRVDDWVDLAYGQLRRGVRHNYKRGGVDAAIAGRHAGRTADTGSAGHLRQRMELARG